MACLLLVKADCALFSFVLARRHFIPEKKGKVVILRYSEGVSQGELGRFKVLSAHPPPPAPLLLVRLSAALERVC